MMNLPELHNMVLSGDIAGIRAHLKKGGDVNLKAKNGAGAIMYAAEKNNAAIVKLLIDAGADPNLANKMGGTALNRAAENGNLEMMSYLFENGAKAGPLALIIAAREGQLPAVKLLLKHGVDINARQPWGQTALMQAAREGHLDVCTYLVRHGADVAAKDK
ncbi:MAG: ankyrin repeat domain-containing protein, partial [Cyclonatronaceae bacterium]